MAILSAIFGPAFLVNNIPLIAILIGGVLLALFSRYVNEKIVFPVADFLREKTNNKLKKKVGRSKFVRYFGESIATFIFILYCYFSTGFLADNFFTPLLTAFKDWIVIVLLVVFFFISLATNDRNFREKFM